MRWLFLLILFFGSAVNAQNAPNAPMTAFGALGLLPPEVARRIAIIEGRDGTPMPERWYLVVYDPAQEHRLTEYVVAGGRVVAARPVSQFAQDLSPEDIIRIDGGLMNSDRVFQIVEQFARANNLRVAQINYRLKKEGTGSAPLWKITCLDDTSNPFAGMVVAANSGTILQTNGFNLPPNTLSSNNANSVTQRPATPPAVSPDEGRPPEERIAPGEKKKSGGQAASLQNKRNRGKGETRRQGKPEPVAERAEGFFGALRRIFHAPR